MTNAVPFSWRRGDHAKRESWCGLARFWQSTGGYEIWQGRPDPTRRMHFVYRLVRPNGEFEDFRLIAEAKARGRALAEEAA